MSTEFAVIETGGKQYRVAAGDVLEVEKLPKPEKGDEVIFSEVLLHYKGEKVELGKPRVAGATVIGQWLGEDRRKKILVSKFKRKTGYRKKYGHRQPFTQIKIKKISRGS